MKIVGLKIEPGRVAAAILEKGMRQAELKDSFSLAYATDSELLAILQEKSRDWAGARIVSSLPGRRFSGRILSFPFNDRKRVEKALPFELEDLVPFSLDEVEVDHAVLERTGEAVAGKKKEATVLALMLPKSVLQQHLELLASAGVDPQAIVPSFIGLSRVATMVPGEGVALFIDGNDLCLKNGNDVLDCRSFSLTQATAGLRHMVKAIETEHGITIEKAYLLTQDETTRAALADLGIAVEHMESDFHGKKAADPVSLGLALSEQVNFRKGAFAYRMADTANRSRRRTLIIAGALAAMLALVNLGVKMYLVQTSYGKVDREINELFRQAVPDAKVFADPVRQLRTRLDEAKKKFGVLGTGSSVLDVMKAVTEGIPKEVRVSFQEFVLESDRLKLSGEAASFESVDKMKAELQKSPLFAEVAVQDTRMGVDNKVKFRFEMKLKQSL